MSSADATTSLPTLGTTTASPVATKRRTRKSRGKGLRTRTGCTACRSRRVKCSEDKPTCRGCKKTNRECVYLIDPSSARLIDDVDDAATDQRGDTPELEPELDFSDRLNDADEADILESAAACQPGSLLGIEPYMPQQHSNGVDIFGASPDSSWSGSVPYSAETASLRWFGLLATDATQNSGIAFSPSTLHEQFQNGKNGALDGNNSSLDSPAQQLTRQSDAFGTAPGTYISQDEVSLRDDEIPLFQHFVQDLSSWIDVTDHSKSFSILVPQMALCNWGLMNAILALSSQHLSLMRSSRQVDQDRATQAVEYYSKTLRYLQHVMKIVSYLRSDELLATVLIISTYEMIAGSGRGWERHLKGVFWIQRSQLIHGESQGLKRWIWWAWLRQDIWAAFRERRKILSFYTLTQACADLDFWDLVNRAVFLLGQCVNYASDTEAEAGRLDVSCRSKQGENLMASLEEWRGYFASHDRRLPTVRHADSPFVPVWINPPAASLAVQVHHFSKLLLLEHLPAIGGLRELSRREPIVQDCVDMICGIASCTKAEATVIVSTQCLFAAGMHVRNQQKQDAIVDMLSLHQSQTGWPHYDLGAELRVAWRPS